jgi:hypothetical protein
MYSNSRGILYTSPPTADENANDAADEPADSTGDVTAETDAEDATVTEADANWTGDVAADD